ncbi:hypothetical protein HK104_000093 [Borealophlyctis nickersoniae]|nr:hypothetical protein HK104_000093 [Borealophlyctis nickersoniae]
MDKLKSFLVRGSLMGEEKDSATTTQRIVGETDRLVAFADFHTAAIVLSRLWNRLLEIHTALLPDVTTIVKLIVVIKVEMMTKIWRRPGLGSPFPQLHLDVAIVTFLSITVASFPTPHPARHSPSRAKSPALDEGGIRNIGQTCYISATLQMLFHSPYREVVLNFKTIDEEQKRRHVRAAIVQVFNQKQDRREVDIRPVRNAIQDLSGRFATREQEDAHEFLVELLDALRLDGPKCPTSSTFRLELQRIIRCTGCGNESKAREYQLDLPATLPDESSKFTLPLLVNNFFKDETISYKCDNCNAVEATSHYLITHLPPVLIVHVKRFGMDIERNKTTKRREPVDIPMILDVGRWCDTDTVVPPAPKRPKPSPLSTLPSPPSSTSDPLNMSEEDQLRWAMGESLRGQAHDAELERAIQLSLGEGPESGQIAQEATPETHQEPAQNPSRSTPMNNTARIPYELSCIVSHIGDTTAHGHYVCDVYDPRTQLWTNYNDSSVREGLQGVEKRRASKGYLLVYVVGGDASGQK